MRVPPLPVAPIACFPSASSAARTPFLKRSETPPLFATAIHRVSVNSRHFFSTGCLNSAAPRFSRICWNRQNRFRPHRLPQILFLLRSFLVCFPNWWFRCFVSLLRVSITYSEGSKWFIELIRLRGLQSILWDSKTSRRIGSWCFSTWRLIQCGHARICWYRKYILVHLHVQQSYSYWWSLKVG